MNHKISAILKFSLLLRFNLKPGLNAQIQLYLLLRLFSKLMPMVMCSFRTITTIIFRQSWFDHLILLRYSNKVKGSI